MDVKLVKLSEENISESYKIKRTSEKYVGLINDILTTYFETYKTFSDLIGIYLDDKIIGLVVLTNTLLNGTMSFTDLVIDEDYQNLGYGTLAVKQIIKYFKNLDKSNVIKIVVFKENIKAIKCYEKCGFKISNHCEKDDNFLVMEKTLND